MKKLLLYLLLSLPLLASAQTNGTLQKTTGTGTIRGSFGSAGVDTLPPVRSLNTITNGQTLVWSSAFNKLVPYTLPSVPVGLQDSLTKKANRNFDNVAAGAIANVKLANSTISGISLGSNLAALTNGYGLSAGGTYNGGTARTFAVDTTAIRTVANSVSLAGLQTRLNGYVDLTTGQNIGGSKVFLNSLKIAQTSGDADLTLQRSLVSKEAFLEYYTGASLGWRVGTVAGSNDFSILNGSLSTVPIKVDSSNDNVIFLRNISAASPTFSATSTIQGNGINIVNTVGNNYEVRSGSPGVTNDSFQIYNTSASREELRIKNSGAVMIPNLTASQLVATNGSKDLVSTTVLPSGVTATTQSPGDNSTNVATTAYVDAVGANVVKLSPGAQQTGAINVSGSVQSGNLSGTGTRSVQTDASGTLSAGPILASGTYSPVLTPVTNVSAGSIASARYTRVGNQVTVFIEAEVTVSSTGSIVFYITLPVASAMTSTLNLSGLGTCQDTTVSGMLAIAEPTSDQAFIQANATSTGASKQVYISFMYSVL